MALLHESIFNALRHKAFASGAKAKVVVSPERIVPLVFNTLARSGEYLHQRIVRLGKGNPPPMDMTARIVRMVISKRRGSLYAALLTSIDYKGIYHGDQFALALSRLGITRDLADMFDSAGYGSFGYDMQQYASFYWADAVAEELQQLKEDLVSPIVEAIKIGMDTITTTDIDDLLEGVYYKRETPAFISKYLPSPKHTGPKNVDPHLPSTKAEPKRATQWRASMRKGYSSIGGQAVRTYKRVGAVLLRTPFLELPTGQTLDGTLEAFFRTILASPQKLMQILPNVSFAEVPLTASDLSRILSKSSVRQKLRQAFSMAYDSSSHVISVGRLYQGADTFGVYSRLLADIKSSPAGREATFDSASALFAAIVGVFVLFLKKGMMAGVSVGGAMRTALKREE
jgi:hypothetical protein